jgi:hypothetical protein
MRREGWWHTPLILLVAALVLFGLIFVELRARATRAQREEILLRAEPLELERDRLTIRRDQRQAEVDRLSHALATEQLLFLELDPLLMTEAFPALQERELPGVLGLSAGNLPDDPGKISRADYDRLLAAGWEACLIYEGGDDFAAWDRDMSARLAAAGIEKPRTVYFPEDRYDAALDPQILECGYTVAVHHGESFRPLIAGEVEGELWLTGAHPWNYDGVREQIRSVVNKGGQHCYTLRFTEGREAYRADSFQNMLDFIQPFLDEGQLVVTGFQQARDLHDPALNGADEARAQWLQEKAELDARIHELDGQIQEIYAEWNGEADD